MGSGGGQRQEGRKAVYGPSPRVIRDEKMSPLRVKFNFISADSQFFLSNHLSSYYANVCPT